jgi:outer membrane lipoprotein SlyB
MQRMAVVLALAAACMAGCSRGEALEVTTGSDVTLQKKDGVIVSGRLVEVQPDRVVVESRGERVPVRRADIATMRAEVKPAEPAVAPAADRAAKVFDRAPEYREVTIPAGTVLPVELQTAVGSDTSNVEDAVRGTLRRAVTVGGVEALPAGTTLHGLVTAAERSGRVKGRARIALRFTRLASPHDAERVAISTGTIARLAEATKKQDAAKIGGGAAGGAIIGGILGGGDGAAKGAAIGGAAGTGVVLSTRGKEVRLGPGADLSVRLQAPVTVRVPVRSSER